MNPVAALAMQMVAQPGVFALLLGSGISRAAEIPTGYEVVLDLIRRYAQAEGDDCEPDPAAWYHSRFGREASYGDLLSRLAPLPTGRQALLKSYFEATEEDVERGAKRPTTAHRIVAELVRDGLVSVIVTTNFDKLIERALEGQGITPRVISSESDAQGATPLQHNVCTVLKLHGDYLDESIRNTEMELSSYGTNINRLLDRVLDEYGLVIVGWSGEYDKALRDGFARRTNRRYPICWMVREAFNDTQKKIAGNHDAVAIEHESANSFFEELAGAIGGAKELAFASSRALQPEAARATLKSLLAHDKNRIRLSDFVNGQTQALFDALANDHFGTSVNDEVPRPTNETVAERLREFETLAQTMMSIQSTGHYWAANLHSELLISSIRRVGNAAKRVAGIETWINLQYYPALLLAYAAGIGMVQGGKEERLLDLWSLRLRHPIHGDRLAVEFLIPWSILRDDEAKALPTMPGRRLISPWSDYLVTVLRDCCRDIAPDQLDYERAFDRFEYLSTLVQVDLTSRDGPPYYFVGRLFKGRRFDLAGTKTELSEEIKQAGGDWSLLKAGLFGGDADKLSSALHEIYGEG